MTSPTVGEIFDLAVRQHQAGQLQQAENLYRQILARHPQHAEALGYLGIIASQLGRPQQAVDFIRQALAINPNDADAWCNLGNALKEIGQLDEAIAANRRAIALNPNLAEAHSNLGNALREKGRTDEAIAALRRAIALNPNFPEALNNLASALKDQGLLDDSIAAYRQAIALRPGFAAAYFNLGIALKAARQLDDAIVSFRQAIALKPNYPEARNNLGNALIESGQFEQGIAALRAAISLRPDYAEAHSNLGNLLRNRGQFDEAAQLLRQAVALKPDYAAAYINLGSLLKDIGQPDQAIAAYRRALALQPNNPQAHSGLIFTMTYDPDIDHRAILAEVTNWDQQYAAPLRSAHTAYENDRSPDRRLKIGYVSPDFRTHPIGRFMLPLLKAHDRKQFEIYCYSGTRFPDEVTSALRQHADIWHDAPNLSDPALANLIHRDRIDILVDLTMHMVHNRLLVFARKPAPIQITYLAYPGTTGLQAIDYRITDPYLDPPGMDEAVYSERTIRLPRSYWCYEPGLEAALDVAPVPLLRNGFITFGCQNNYCKISPQAWNAWQRILSAVPQSRLLVYTPPGDHRDTARQILADAGIDPSRLLFSESRNIDYFRCYNRIDIALDSFPYVGGTTTCDALWMGVPVVTLAGRMASGRGGVSILTNIGLPDLIARTPEEYVAIAVALAADLPRLERLRSTMRDRMRNSPLMDPSPFAASMESIYRQVWREWCSNGREPS